MNQHDITIEEKQELEQMGIEKLRHRNNILLSQYDRDQATINNLRYQLESLVEEYKKERDEHDALKKAVAEEQEERRLRKRAKTAKKEAKRLSKLDTETYLSKLKKSGVND